MIGTKKLAAAVAVGAVAAGAVLSGCSTSNQEWHNGCTVTAKDTLYSSSDGNTSREYRLSTSCGTFAVEDSIAGGFNSWDTWQALKEGARYDIRTGGYRVGFLSTFPTVLEVKPAK
ncbi:hypothetical protein SEA_LEMOND_57 [Mycobacterium phage LeMond]|uniref:Lipoprotein n=1 Tax=Mycobacterium phage KiSi TaxID=2507856 RepID=A0A410TBR5_9CAUD|nr:secreted protein [Mycobacterium phage KiSi]AYR01122.1 hypothetical protein SEA_LEMOND_57 [Mycobacterium phage LeMond]AYR01224.1 hypothetical protein SEA_OSCAR_57 [Mycobacterium phage Oscar]AYR01657.1 hypothetical protein SEA_SCARLETT_57 [Mycobacterium phage Scarlett]QAU06475.1 hypothetical protein SEA_KISI_57 [Mycobacterium phage KiSi]